MTEQPHRRVHVPVHLRWGDLDALGHVNNATMLKLLEEARLRAFWVPEAELEAPPTAVMRTELTPSARRVTLIAHQEVEYLRPVPYSQRPLDVQLWFGNLGGSSAEVCYEVCSPAGSEPQTVYARATSTVVLVDAGTGRPTRLPADMREAWTPFLGPAVRFARRR